MAPPATLFARWRVVSENRFVQDAKDAFPIDATETIENADLDPSPTWSGVSHGTMVASIAAAKGWNNIGIRGVAPNASLKAYKVTAAGAYNDNNEINALGSSPLASDVSVFNMSYGSGTLGTALLPLPSDAEFAQIAPGATSLRSNKGA